MRNLKKNLFILSMLALIGILPQCTEKSTQVEPQVMEVINSEPELSLYDRLGGEEGVSSIVDDILTKHLSNPIVSEKFSYLSQEPEKMETVKRHLREFLGAGTGGTEQYTGVDVPTAHKGMNVSNEEFLAAVDDILEVLNEHNVSDQTKKDMLFILYSFKGQVIGL